MYKKLLHIKNYGRFINYSSKLSDWDGSFQKINIVYAPNGSGKTSLAELFRSTSGDSDIVIKKQTFGTDQNPDIKFILDDGKELKFNGKWNRSIANIDVFDSFYFDDNLYAISIYDDPQQPNIFELAISEEIALIKKTIFTLKSNKSSLSHKISNKKNYLRKNCLDYDSDNKLAELIDARNQLDKQISDLHKDRIRRTEEQRNKYLKSINSYLSLFCDTMKLTEVNLIFNPQANIQSLVYGIEICGHHIVKSLITPQTSKSLSRK